MIRFLDNGLGSKQGVTKDKIRQVSMVQRHGTQEQRFFLGPNPQGQAAVVFDRYSRHGNDPPGIVYTFKLYIEKQAQAFAASTGSIWYRDLSRWLWAESEV
jgi:hypothetical protein